ncbi:MAG: sulfotransferase family 2 domain-containing protein [Candidatus Azotimanducaceae bacterium]
MYAFIHIPKTAGTTLRFLFRSAFSANHCDARLPLHRRKKNIKWLHARDMRIIKLAYPKLMSISGHNVCSFTDLDQSIDDIQYFTVLRDPVQRFISSFNHKYRRDIDALTLETLEKFIQNPANHNVQTRWLCGEENADVAIQAAKEQLGFVGLTEQFDESLVLLKQWINSPSFNINYVTRRKAPKKAALPYLEDARIYQMILDVNQEDIKLYNYVKDELFPQQVADYGDSFNEDLANFHQQQQSFEGADEPRWSVAKRNLIYKILVHLPFV